jgi:Brp/Blh family beta-carotene 15,15'-monooxygenase
MVLMAVRISLSRKRLYRELLHLALIVLTFALFDVLYAFAIYFVIWHSLPSIYAQIIKVNQHFTWRHLKRYCLHALPIYLVSLLFIAGIMWFFTTRFDQMESYVLSPFIALTMAHAVLFAIFLQMPAVTKSPSE